MRVISAVILTILLLVGLLVGGCRQGSGPFESLRNASFVDARFSQNPMNRVAIFPLDGMPDAVTPTQHQLIYAKMTRALRHMRRDINIVPPEEAAQLLRAYGLTARWEQTLRDYDRTGVIANDDLMAEIKRRLGVDAVMQGRLTISDYRGNPRTATFTFFLVVAGAEDSKVLWSAYATATIPRSKEFDPARADLLLNGVDVLLDTLPETRRRVIP
ncbi:MAG: hypothetical protein ACYDBB_16900 [Armatimonadota bacterium]